MKLEFSLDQPTHTKTLAAESEILTNCDAVHITLIFCGERFSNYATAKKGDPITLPAGEYEFMATQYGCNKCCSICIRELNPSAPDIETFPYCNSETLTIWRKVVAYSYSNGEVVESVVSDTDTGIGCAEPYVIEQNFCITQKRGK